ncbi:MAG: hypothetical protein VX259_02515, partial [Pseudomonadota bacterium]|nr:hypothetical protein [Pseudomonadota bacterium]
MQRGLHLSAAGIHQLLPNGLGRDGHMRAADTINHPFDAEARTELDVAWAAYRIAGLAPGGKLKAARTAKTAALQRARALLAPAEQFMHDRMAPTVAIAAAVWHVVLMAFMACLMQWPDHHVAKRFYDGCRIVEEEPRSNLFRPARSPPAVPLAEYLAENDLSLYENKCQMGEDTAEIHDTLVDETPAGFGTEPRPAAHWDALYGRASWRGLVRWMHEQPNGKRRPIDDAKWGGQNAATAVFEKLHCISVDFPVHALKCLYTMIGSFFPDPWR